MTKSNPIDPIPTVIPEIIAFDNLTPNNNAIIIIIIGKKTVDPNPINHCNAATIFISPFYLIFLLFNISINASSL